MGSTLSKGLLSITSRPPSLLVSKHTPTSNTKMVYSASVFSDTTGYSTRKTQHPNTTELSEIPAFNTTKSMDKFEASVDTMVNEVFIPSRLMDKNADSETSKWAESALGVSPRIAQGDLYAIYIMVKDMKEEMVKSIVSKPKISPEAFSKPISKSSSISSLTTSSDEYSDSGDYDGDSSTSDGLIGYDFDTYVSPKLAQDFTYHLSGLRHCLSQLSSAAEFVTEASRKTNDNQ